MRRLVYILFICLFCSGLLSCNKEQGEHISLFFKCKPVTVDSLSFLVETNIVEYSFLPHGTVQLMSFPLNSDTFILFEYRSSDPADREINTYEDFLEWIKEKVVPDPYIEIIAFHGNNRSRSDVAFHYKESLDNFRVLRVYARCLEGYTGFAAYIDCSEEVSELMNAL